MTKLRFDITVSADGFVAGPNQSERDPLGEGGRELHDWALGLESWRGAHGMEGGEVNASNDVVEESLAGLGATIMGRNMFGPVRGPWGEDPWRGWWGDDPPFRRPVFVLTHHAREPLTLGDTTFTFVTDGIDSALDQAREAAGDQDVHIAGGANTAQQYLTAGLIDEMELHIVPTLLGSGERLLEDVGDLRLEQIRAVEAPGVSHIKYRVVR